MRHRKDDVPAISKNTIIPKLLRSGERNMVKINNIVRNRDTIECDYYPEGKDKKGHVVVSLVTEDYVELEIVPEFENEHYKSYAAHAAYCLLELSTLDKIPEEYVVYWY